MDLIVTGTDGRDYAVPVPGTPLGAPAQAAAVTYPALPPHTIDPRVGGIANAAATANRLDLQRVFGGPLRISKLLINVGTASGNICLAVYSNTGTGTAARPDQLLGTTGSVACPAAGVAQVPLVAPVTVQPGMWFGIVSDNATATFARTLGGAYSPLTEPFSCRMTGTFPAPATLSGLTANASVWLIGGVE
jgi:hypothetical protein